MHRSLTVTRKTEVQNRPKKKELESTGEKKNLGPAKAQ